MVLYHLERMRQSWLYNSYLHPEAVDHLMDRLWMMILQHHIIVRYHLKNFQIPPQNVLRYHLKILSDTT